jgi:hypothetical protein
MKKVIFVLLCLLGSFSSISIYAQGDLYVTPSRVILEGRNQKAILSVANTGKETATYSISFVERRMNEDGSFTSIEIPDSGAPFAAPYLRIYPRQVTLGPNEGQSVVLQVRRSTTITDGEYRSHLYFRSEKDYLALGEEAKDSIASVNIKLIPIFGISIPVIVRSGNVISTATLSNLAINLKNQKKEITFTINREGNGSVYGDLKVEYIQPNKKPVEVGAVNGVAVYTNIDKRKMTIDLSANLGLKISGGLLKVSYLERETQILIAEAEISL